MRGRFDRPHASCSSLSPPAESARPLVELGRLNTDVVPLAMRIMDESATAEEYYAFAERLVAMARRLQNRATHVGLLIDGEVAIAADQNVNGAAGTVYHQDL